MNGYSPSMWEHVVGTWFCWCQPSAIHQIDGVIVVHRATLDTPRDPNDPSDEGPG